ncbi:hypothetical protein AYO38_03405 [bacterium SCGC AG-212-C10]|nr:hypothetical protein AYO38_03405 [bacterium SCGC AG-212-C10]
MSVSANSGRRISISRLLILLVFVAGIILASTKWAMAQILDSGENKTTVWFAPYVDVTLTPQLHFEDASEQPATTVVLGFIVADSVNVCEPSWGTYYTLDAASRALDMDRRVVRLRERGGDAIVSFGGAVNNELATVCEDPDKLTAAYQTVIDRYALKVIDFDIEGASLGNEAANARRATVIKRLQEANAGLKVWLTVPVAPHGMTRESIALIDQALATGVEFTGFNVMTMDYGGSKESTQSMSEASIAALTATWQQLDGAYVRAGTPLTEAQIWSMIGATPMIGQNDVAGEVFSLGDADKLMTFARTVALGRISMWSANRDVACGSVVEGAGVSNTCSGVSQEPQEFARIFAGHPPKTPDKPKVTGTETRIGGLARDDPRTSPYPLWRAAKTYTEGNKVVWGGRVYQAKWFTKGNQPDAPIKDAWETPWRYLGPVLDSDRDAVRADAKVVDGTRPKWQAEVVYIAGDEVEFELHAFRAKWWTQGDLPQVDPDQPYDNPWEYLGEVKPPEDK